MAEISIHKAAGDGDIVAVKKLLDQNPSLVNLDDEHQWRPIFHAGLRKQFDVVKLLIERGADLSAHEGYVMHYAGEVPNNKKIVELLISYGALESHTQPKSEMSRQFIWSVFMANGSRTLALLKSMPSLIAERYSRGDLALHHATRNGDLEIVKILVGSGADINAVTDQAQFPLYCAAGHGHVEVTAYLMSRKADTRLKLKDGKTIVEWLKQFVDNNKQFQECYKLVTS